MTHSYTWLVCHPVTVENRVRFPDGSGGPCKGSSASRAHFTLRPPRAELQRELERPPPVCPDKFWRYTYMYIAAVPIAMRSADPNLRQSQEDSMNEDLSRWSAGCFCYSILHPFVPMYLMPHSRKVRTAVLQSGLSYDERQIFNLEIWPSQLRPTSSHWRSSYFKVLATDTVSCYTCYTQGTLLKYINFDPDQSSILRPWLNSEDSVCWDVSLDVGRRSHVDGWCDKAGV